jgi:hypothetical protein
MNMQSLKVEPYAGLCFSSLNKPSQRIVVHPTLRMFELLTENSFM